MKVELEANISRASTEDLMRGFIGDRSKSAVNHLVTCILNVPQLVSKHVVTELVQKHDINFLVQLRNHQICESPAVAEWVFVAEVLKMV